MIATNLRIAAAFALVSLSALGGCVTDRPLAGNGSLDRSPAELATLEKEAAAGNGEAAYIIAQYYGFVALDDVLERRWLERAAALHWRPAVASLGNALVESTNPKDRRRGRALLTEARILP